MNNYLDFIKKHLIECILILFPLIVSGQINFTANDIVKTPTPGEIELFGSNLGYYPPYDNKTLAELAADAGVKTMRPTIPGIYLDEIGLYFKASEFEHMKNLGMKDLTVFLEKPAYAEQDYTNYCNDGPSKIWANLYAPIWDDGENATPINDDNFYAKYVYNTVSAYKDYVKFWEVINEPDFDWGVQGWKSEAEFPGDNWWENDPDPCLLENIKAPIEYYVRMLRITYEIVKYVDPSAYVSIAGLGYPAFLDAILRNTDNPVDGSVTAEYPLKGGAFFEVMAMHAYPHFDGSTWERDANGVKVNNRHSDAAAYGVNKKKSEYEQIFDEYGYNGDTYPHKQYIITETNVPREAFRMDEDGGIEHIGSEEAQLNYFTKMVVNAKRENVLQFHLFNLADSAPGANGTYREFERMGLYQQLNSSSVNNELENLLATAYRTSSTLLTNAVYDKTHTEAMDLPISTDGAAFYLQDEEKYIYVLWAKTTIDRSEVANAQYDFPLAIENGILKQYNWDFSTSKQELTASSINIQLNGRPVFFKGNNTTSLTCEDPSACNYSPIPGGAACEFNSCSGCTHPQASNYDASASIDNNSCDFSGGIFGCTIPEGLNYNSEATINDGTCLFECGCTDPGANNYDQYAPCNDQSCLYGPQGNILGCTDPCAPNYNANANISDNSCESYSTDCDDNNISTTDSYNSTTCSCENVIISIAGCTDPCAPNFNASANMEDNSCENYDTTCNDNNPGTSDNYNTETCSCENFVIAIPGCTDACAANYSPAANVDDNSCLTYDTVCDDSDDMTIDSFDIETCNCIHEQMEISGCTDKCAANYDPNANVDDDSCETYDSICDDGNPATLDSFNANNCNCVHINFSFYGCTDRCSANYNPEANIDDDSCESYDTTCDDENEFTIDSYDTNSCSCVFTNAILGCMDQCAANYNPSANLDDDSCASYSTDCADGIAETRDFYDYDQCKCIHDLNVGIDEEAQFLFSVFPNPSNGQFVIVTNKATASVPFSIRSITGKEVFKGNILAGQNRIDIRGIASGLYLIELSIDQSVQSQKIIIQ